MKLTLLIILSVLVSTSAIGKTKPYDLKIGTNETFITYCGVYLHSPAHFPTRAEAKARYHDMVPPSFNLFVVIDVECDSTINNIWFRLVK